MMVQSKCPFCGEWTTTAIHNCPVVAPKPAAAAYKSLREQAAEAIDEALDIKLLRHFQPEIIDKAAEAAIKAVMEGMRCRRCKHWTSYHARPDLGACAVRGDWTWDESDGCIKWEAKE